MTIDSLRISPVEPVVFVDLSGYHVLKRTREAGIIQNPGQWMPPQTPKPRQPCGLRISS